MSESITGTMEFAAVLFIRRTARKVSKYGVISGPYFPAFGLNTDQKLLRIWTLFTQCRSTNVVFENKNQSNFSINLA